jgi:repressor LexA
MSISVGKLLREVRKSKNITQVQVSEVTGFSQGYLADIENNKANNPSMTAYFKIGQALGIPETKIIELIFHDYLNEKKGIESNNFVSNIKSFNPIIGDIAQIPVLGSIPAGKPVEALENIHDYVEVPANDVKNGEFFYLEVSGDSMIGSRINEGDLVLVRRQPDVENGEIAVVRVNYEAATLKRVKKVNGQVLLYPDNPKYEPMLVKEEGAEIIGKVVKVEFNPNKKY